MNGDRELQKRLRAVLAAKDERAELQREILQRWGGSLVYLTLVSPGTVKNSRDRSHALLRAADILEKTLWNEGFSTMERGSRASAAGPEYYFAVKGDACAIKSLCARIEEELPWGRILDIDVLRAKGNDIEALHRESVGHECRKCLVCERPAFECMAEGRHRAEEISDAFGKLLQLAAQKSCGEWKEQ